MPEMKLDNFEPVGNFVKYSLVLIFFLTVVPFLMFLFRNALNKKQLTK